MKRMTTFLTHNLAWFAAVGALLATLLLSTAGAEAAAVGSQTGITSTGQSYFYLYYNAEPGENNDLEITYGNGGLVFEDSVSVLASSGCQQLTSTSARCGVDGGEDLRGYFVAAGDGVNEVRNQSWVGLHVTGTGGINEFTGGTGADTLIGDAEDDELLGRGGADELRGGGGEDRLAPGSDTFADVVTGEAGRDIVDYSDRSSAVTVTLDGLANDGASGEGDKVSQDVEDVLGGGGDDRLVGSSGANQLYGLGGRDDLIGNGGSDTLVGGLELDHLYGGDGIDGMFAGPGNDRLYGGALGDTLNGDQGDDWLHGEGGPDKINGGADLDVVSYDGYTSRVHVDLDGEQGDDGSAAEGDSVGADVEAVIGGVASDELVGNAADNILRGGQGNDLIEGGAGADQLFGDYDNDTFVAADGVADTIECGEDADDASAADSVDQLTECEVGPAKSEPVDPAGFELGKLKRNRTKGTARLAVSVTAPGDVALNGSRKIRARTIKATQAGTVVLKVKAKGKAAAKLRRTGSLRAKLDVSYVPAGGDAVTKSKRVKLVRR